MNTIENFYYESLPFIYAMFAIVGFSYHQQSKVAVAAAAVCALCSYLVFNMRYRYRGGFQRRR